MMKKGGETGPRERTLEAERPVPSGKRGKIERIISPCASYKFLSAPEVLGLTMKKVQYSRTFGDVQYGFTSENQARLRIRPRV